MKKEEWIELYVNNFLATYSSNMLLKGFAVDSNKETYSTMIPIENAYRCAEYAWVEKEKYNKMEYRNFDGEKE